jgi:LuxR family transcriptional regulator
MQDPVVRWGMQSVGRVRWVDLEAMDEGGGMDQAKDFGLMNGAAIALVRSGSRSVGGFARADRDYSEEEMADLEDLLARLHHQTLDLGRFSAADQRALTELAVKLTH